MQLKKEQASQAGPPGYDPSLDAKPKSKSVKRNERKKEKRLQVCYVLILPVSMVIPYSNNLTFTPFELKILASRVFVVNLARHYVSS